MGNVLYPPRLIRETLLASDLVVGVTSATGVLAIRVGRAVPALKRSCTESVDMLEYVFEGDVVLQLTRVDHDIAYVLTNRGVTKKGIVSREAFAYMDSTTSNCEDMDKLASFVSSAV